MNEIMINRLLIILVAFGIALCTSCVPFLSNNPDSKTCRFIFQAGMILVLVPSLMSKFF